MGPRTLVALTGPFEFAFRLGGLNRFAVGQRLHTVTTSSADVAAGALPAAALLRIARRFRPHRPGP